MQLHVGSKHLVADVAVALDVHGREHLVVVAKGTWSIPQPGQRPRPLPPQALVMADEFYGEPGVSPLRCGSDFARFKPRCDVIFDACAHAPQGSDGGEVSVITARWQVGAAQKLARVCGPRSWTRTLGVARLGAPQPLGLSEFLCVRRFLNLPSCCSARREGEAVFVQYRELVHR
jgi:hypothetical protein